MSRLRDDGWLIAVHEGRWNPTALIMATAGALSEKLPGPATANPRIPSARRWPC